METKRLIIKVLEDNDSDFASIKGYCDGELLFSGFYGGEPEDNSRYRNYSWVEDAIESVAKLGNIAVEYCENSDEDS